MGLREEKKRQTRERIEQSAFELFAEHGYRAAKTADIAAAAHTSESTLFRYFASKEDIALAPLLRRKLLMLEGVAAQPMDRSPIEAAVDFASSPEARALIPDITQQTEWSILLSEVELRPRVLEVAADAEILLAIHFLKRPNVSDILTASVYATSLVGVLRSIVSLWVAEPEGFDPLQATLDAFNLLTKGLR